MGVGRNMAYKKEEFFNVNGFIDHMQIRTGDDEFLSIRRQMVKIQRLLLRLKVFQYPNLKLLFQNFLIKKEDKLPLLIIFQ
jgi:hypothetical protein